MIGKPKYKMGDKVSFTLRDDNDIFNCEGEIWVVDAYGTFRQNTEPSYDIMVENWRNSGTQMFVKHIEESLIDTLISSGEKDMGLDPCWRFNSTQKY